MDAKEKSQGFGIKVRRQPISARTRYILYTSIFVVTTAASIYLVIRYSEEIAGLHNYGYLGIFLVAFIAGSSIPTPISFLLLTFTLGGILNPVIVGVAAGIGAGVGGTLVYLLGRGGRRFWPGIRRYDVDEQASNKLAVRFVNLAHKRGSMIVFLMSALLNPAFAPMAIAMGALRFRMIKFLIMCIAGNTLKAMVVALLGYLGVGSLLRLFG